MLSEPELEAALGQNSFSVHRLSRWTIAIALLAFVAAACGGVADQIEYKDPTDRALFKIPNEWHLYTSDELAVLGQVPFVTPAGATPLTVLTQVAFDGAPGREVSNLDVSVASAGYPVGAYTIRSVGFDDRSTLSRQLMSEAVLSPLEYTVGQDLLLEDFDFGREYEGIRRFMPFTETATADQGIVYFVSVTDPDDTRVFSMAAGCSNACWETYGDDIVKVVDSWLVNTRQ